MVMTAMTRLTRRGHRIRPNPAQNHYYAMVSEINRSEIILAEMRREALNLDDTDSAVRACLEQAEAETPKRLVYERRIIALRLCKYLHDPTCAAKAHAALIQLMCQHLPPYASLWYAAITH